MAIHPNDLSSSSTAGVIIKLYPNHDPSSSAVNTTIDRPTQDYVDDPNSCHNLIRDLVFWRLIMVVLVIILGFVFLIFYGTRNVKSPNLAIDSLTLSNLSVSSRLNQISADWNVQMSLKPVDSHGYLKFSNISLLISYNDKITWNTYLTSFHVSPKNPPMHFGKEFLVWSGNVDDSTISDIRQHINAGKVVKFNVVLSAWVKPTYVNGWVRNLLLDGYWWMMNCENVELFFGTADASRGQMLNASHTCKFEKFYTS
ncbi:hypothetical protein POM88_001547 [Heracleum sosnowskyi]|uniref:Late embryogenesis abundant protein LEA-2 subgroup domain-containing protein n=1 Tax=Heracleum sosnowskyi TaxID=360622 RepID=A0AAD8NAI5_9APIA|nr:hypothetical protein POM88_001547 [Heracleum sosnowskyi]